jgi:tetraacyldisaccharide 4'-kinase
LKRLDQYWQTRNPVALGLLPLAGLFCAVSQLRALAYRQGLLSSRRLPVPVLVVGNITVGGTGKTPTVIWLCGHLRELGLKPGILLRGYRGKGGHWPQAVAPDSDPVRVGDEAVLLARRTGCPVVAGPDRVADGRYLLDRFDCDILVADDGMQHYALARDLEIAVIDGRRRFGNGFCLPAGPLREPTGRLRRTDLSLVTGTAGAGEACMELVPGEAVNLAHPQTRRPLASFAGQAIMGVAAIGNPQRFFDTLRANGLEVSERPFPDHHGFQPADLERPAGMSLLMTEKDAVKCLAFADADCWYVPVQGRPSNDFVQRLDHLLGELPHHG